MFSVTQRVKKIKQPYGGYVPAKMFKTISIDDGKKLSLENLAPNLVGTAVDYMTRFCMGASIDDAFRISLIGAEKVRERDYAENLLKEINGVDTKSIENACKLVGYDVCFRAGVGFYRPVKDIDPDAETIENIQIMINRSIDFWREYGPIISEGFTFQGGYTDIVSSGDGDYLTEDTIWDFKVSKTPPNKNHTLQLLMYYLMGCHSIHAEFQKIKHLGIFNPRLNKVYLLNISDIDTEIIKKVSFEVIGYEE